MESNSISWFHNNLNKSLGTSLLSQLLSLKKSHEPPWSRFFYVPTPCNRGALWLLAYLEVSVLGLCLGTLLQDLLQQQCVLAHALHWLQQVGCQVHAVAKLQLLLLHTHPREHARVCLVSNSHHTHIHMNTLEFGQQQSPHTHPHEHARVCLASNSHHRHTCPHEHVTYSLANKSPHTYPYECARVLPATTITPMST